MTPTQKKLSREREARHRALELRGGTPGYLYLDFLEEGRRKSNIIGGADRVYGNINGHAIELVRNIYRIEDAEKQNFMKAAKKHYYAEVNGQVDGREISNDDAMELWSKYIGEPTKPFDFLNEERGEPTTLYLEEKRSWRLAGK